MKHEGDSNRRGRYAEHAFLYHHTVVACLLRILLAVGWTNTREMPASSYGHLCTAAAHISLSITNFLLQNRPTCITKHPYICAASAFCRCSLATTGLSVAIQQGPQFEHQVTVECHMVEILTRLKFMNDDLAAYERTTCYNILRVRETMRRVQY